jgi:protein MAK16|eukprot:scaffold773_cov218-Chaetoceros_neogracile.AAC.5
MQHDEMIWTVINNQFCSYKTSLSRSQPRKEFCKHPYSITGLCNRSHCPLANSLYATIREDNGRVSLYVKTVERAHSPKNLWERIDLSRNYSKALAQVEEHLQFFPKAMQHRNKQRLTKIHQYLIRMRKLKLRELRGEKAKRVGVNKKIEQREGRREKKALVAAKIENNIEKELLQRLAKGTYGDIYNFPEVPYQKALEEIAESESEEEMEEDSESEEEGLVEYVEDFDDEESLEEDMEDIELASSGEEGESSEEEDSEEDVSSEDDDDDDSGDDDEDSVQSEGASKRPIKKKPTKKPKKRRGTRVEIEYEEEEDQPMQESLVAGHAW